MIIWELVDDHVPADNEIVFKLDTENPSLTPSPNFFRIRVRNIETESVLQNS